MSEHVGIKWFWAHRRNASLHHFSFLAHGLAGKGWAPAVNFWLDNMIVVGVPGKGCYLFYDKDQLKTGAKYKDIQDSIDGNPNFVRDFRRRTDELFGAVYLKCFNIDTENLPLLSNLELQRMFDDFIATIMAAPIITVQLWGIEACFDDNYRIITFLYKRLQELGKSRELEMYKSMLSANTGETVAFTEQKNFYQAASRMAANENVRRLFENADLTIISEGLRGYAEENSLFERHIQKYEWVNTEYVSSSWTRENWIEHFQKAIIDNTPPRAKLDELMANFDDLNKKRNKALEELDPPPDVRHALEALAELIAQRDWTKGYFARCLLSYHKLLDEIAVRLRSTRSDLLNYSYQELSQAIGTANPIPSDMVEDRKANGYAIVIKRGRFSLVTGKDKVRGVIEDERISEPFDKIINVTEFKGMPASPGTIKAKAKVLEDASMIPQLEAGEILVTYMTTIEFIPAFRKAAAVITDEGGMSCHAAIISREFKLPCIVGTKIATRVVKTGDMLEVDANKGTVKILG